MALFFYLLPRFEKLRDQLKAVNLNMWLIYPQVESLRFILKPLITGTTSMFYVGLFVGILIGSIVGFFFATLLITAKRSDAAAHRIIQETPHTIRSSQ